MPMAGVFLACFVLAGGYVSGGVRMAKKRFLYRLVVTCPLCGTRHTSVILTVNREWSGLTQHLSCVCLFCCDHGGALPPYDLAQEVKEQFGHGKEIRTK